MSLSETTWLIRLHIDYNYNTQQLINKQLQLDFDNSYNMFASWNICSYDGAKIIPQLALLHGVGQAYTTANFVHILGPILKTIY